jgi:hypothetical protein
MYNPEQITSISEELKKIGVRKIVIAGPAPR